MGLDVYAGTLTRYLSGNWETIVQQQGRKRGFPVYMARANAPKDAERNQDRIRVAVVRWRDSLSKALQSRLSSPLDWDESPEAPYDTDKPGWATYSALMLWAAYAEHHELKRPEFADEDWSKDPAFQASNVAGFRSGYGQLLHGAQLWLPCPIEFTFLAKGVNGQPALIGSSVSLLSQLEKLNERTWAANEAGLEACRQAGAHKDADTETRAQFALALMRYLALFSVEHRVPMKLDY